MSSSSAPETALHCGARAHACECTRESGHEPPHTCGHTACGGQWNGTYGSDDFEVVTWPGPNDPFLNALTAALMQRLHPGQPPGYETS